MHALRGMHPGVSAVLLLLLFWIWRSQFSLIAKLAKDFELSHAVSTDAASESVPNDLPKASPSPRRTGAPVDAGRRTPEPSAAVGSASPPSVSNHQHAVTNEVTKNRMVKARKVSQSSATPATPRPTSAAVDISHTHTFSPVSMSTPLTQPPVRSTAAADANRRMARVASARSRSTYAPRDAPWITRRRTSEICRSAPPE